MPDLAIAPTIPAMSDAALEKVRDYERKVLAQPQVPIRTRHTLHGGIYSRTVFVPEGVEIIGAQVKGPTTLFIQGDALVNVGDGFTRWQGQHVVTASAGRKQVFQAISDTIITAAFATKAKTIEEAERELTDEYDMLASHRDDLNTVLITGE